MARSHPTLTRRGRRVRAVAMIAAVVLTVLAVAGFGVFSRLRGNITTLDAFTALGQRPGSAGAAAADGPGQPLNILLMGSDSRSGVNAQLGGAAAGARSDTVILVHISGDRKSATAVSIPRDSMVAVPSCPLDSGKAAPAAFEPFNAAFAAGGPTCTIKTVESLTGIRLDHFVVIDFAGFVRMVDALGGVDLCIAAPIKDSNADLDVAAGPQTVDGHTALGLVRARYTLGDGSDLGRIGRQQQFVAAMIRKIHSAGILANPVRLFSFMDAATQSLTTDPALASAASLAALAGTLSGVGAGNIGFLTIPTLPWPQDRNRVMFAQPAADAIWSALKADQAIPHDAPPSTTPSGAGGQPPTPAPASAPSPAHSQVLVRVLDGAGRPGMAQQAAAALRGQGFHVLSVGTAPRRDVSASVVQYGPGSQGAAQAVAGVVAAAPQPVGGQGDPAVTLLLGSDFPSPGPAPAGASGAAAGSTPAPTASSETAADTACLGSR